MKHDEDGSRRLDHKELANMLADISGKEPNKAEVSFVLQMADTSLHDGEIDRDECSMAIASWNVLQQDQDFWEAKFSELDTENVGGLDKTKLKAVLVQLNGGEPVRLAAQANQPTSSSVCGLACLLRRHRCSSTH
eukprot:SAG22_NODE_2062_length_3062_cov_5.668579_3_plen_135_part_00